MISQLLPGTEVRARGLRWEVVLSQPLGGETLYRLRGLDGPLRGRELDLLSPFEPIVPVVQGFQPERAGPLPNWLVYHEAFLLEQALGPHALLAVQPGRLKIEPYQLVPVLRAIRMSRVRLLLADGVGLGKTIQAGLVLTELMARRIAHRVLIVSPAGPLLQQWKTEMLGRFGLRFDTVDRARLEEIRRSTELGANPFDHVPLALASIDFLKQERVLERLEQTAYDVVVLDEAHHCMDLGAATEREDSQRRRLAQVLARRCDAFLLLTATPHDGNDRSFASLCELLDPSLVDGRGALRGEAYRNHVVRRLKKHVKDPVTGAPLFRERQVRPIPVDANPAVHGPFVELQRSLLDLVAPELRRAFRARRYADVLSFISLLKRSVSTVAACASTLQAVASRFQGLVTQEAESQESRRQRLGTLRDYQRKIGRFGVASAEEEEERHSLETEDLAQQLATLQREVRSGSRTLSRSASVVEALDNLMALAQEARPHDPKLAQLAAEIETIRTQEPAANVLVYTEYTTSQAAAAEVLRNRGLTVLTLSGEDDDATRQGVTERFRTRDGLVLVSTDASAEGLNLQDRCHHLLHLELPFNPNRLEQRNGRIDRYGQTRDPIVGYLFLRGTFEERILLRLIAKYERQRARLTFVPNTLGLATASDAANETLLKGLIEEEGSLFRTQPKQVELDMEAAAEGEGAGEATRELLEEIDRSLKGFESACRTHAWLGDSGLNAEEKLLAEAGVARTSGEAKNPVDLPRFVANAVLFDGGRLDGDPADDCFALGLPSAWDHGLESLPGHDPEARCVRLTTRLELTSDAKGRALGFLGRAHPLVRRALDRVRHVSFGASAGGAGGAGEDPRVSAVSGPVGSPALLFTFLGRVSSRAGREFERVLAVTVPRPGPGAGEPRFLATPSAWRALARPENAVRTGGLWEKHFASWADGNGSVAREVAAEGFAPMAAAFRAERRKALQAEVARQEEWLRKRAEEITGTASQLAVQADLFAGVPAGPTSARRPWASTTAPEERLAGFSADGSQHPAHRSEADGVLRLYRQRVADLEARLHLAEPELVPLGLLMIVPEGGRGV